jgi:hypothetical protein
MIILDEQLLGRGLEQKIEAWYRGSVRFITDLRPNTVIKDDAIPLLLRQQSAPTFVTINETDFWQRVSIDAAFCIVCFTLSDARAGELAESLRRLLQLPLLRTKAQRMGKVIRVSGTQITYYGWNDRTLRTIEP